MTQPSGAGGRRRRPPGQYAPRNAWKWFLVFEAVVALIYFPFGIPSGRPRILGVVPWMEWTGQVPAWAVLGLSAVAAIAYGARRYRPKAPVAWWFMGAGVLLFITGDTIYKSWHQIMGQNNIPFPSFVDAIYIAMYPVLAVGFSPAGPLQGTGGRPCQPARRPHHHGRRRPAVLDLPDRAERPGPGRPARPVHSRRLPAGRHPSAGHAGPSLERRAGCARRLAGSWPSGRSGPWWPTRSTVWPVCTRAGTGTTATRSTWAGSSFTAAGERRRSTPR